MDNIAAFSIPGAGPAMGLVREIKPGARPPWLLKATRGPGGLAATNQAAALYWLKNLPKLQPLRWDRPTVAKEDLGRYGLDKPAWTVTLTPLFTSATSSALSLGILLGSAAAPLPDVNALGAI